MANVRSLEEVPHVSVEDAGNDEFREISTTYRVAVAGAHQSRSTIDRPPSASGWRGTFVSLSAGSGKTGAAGAEPPPDGPPPEEPPPDDPVPPENSLGVIWQGLAHFASCYPISYDLT